MRAISEITESPHFGEVHQVCIDPANEYMLSIGEADQMVMAFNLEDLADATGGKLSEISQHSLKGLSFCHTFDSFICGGESHQIVKVSWPEAEEFRVITELRDTITHISCSPKKSTVALATKENKVFFIDYDHVRLINTITDENEISWLKYSPDGKYIGYTSGKQKLVILNSETLEEVLTKTYESVIIDADWSFPHIIYIVDSSNQLKINGINLENQIECKFNVASITNSITKISISNRRYIAIADNKNIITVARLPQEIGAKQENELAALGSKQTAANNILTLTWGVNTFCGGDEDGQIFKWTFEEDGQMENYIDSDEDDEIPREEETQPEKGEKEKTQQKEKLSGFGSLVPNVIDKPTIPKKKAEKAKDHSKQKTLSIGAFATPTPKPKPKPKETPKPKPAPTEETKAPQNFISDEEEIGNPIQNQNYISDESEKEAEIPNQNFISDDDKAENEKPNENSISDKEESNKPKENFISDESEGGVGIPSDLEDSGNEMPPADGVHFSEPHRPELPTYIETMTPTFMPGSSKYEQDGQKLLCWNMYGNVVRTTTPAGEYVIDVLPSEMSSFNAKRYDATQSLDVIGASINDVGLLLFGNDFYHYRMLTHYADDAESRTQMPIGQSICLGAVGSSWFAVATTSNELYILTNTNIPLTTLALDGRPITMQGAGTFLFVVSGGSHHFQLLDIENQKCEAEGELPVRQPLRWVNVDPETAEVYVLGGDYIVYNLTYQFGTTWTPVLDLKTQFEEHNSFFPAYAFEYHIFGAFCQENESPPLPVPSDPEAIPLVAMTSNVNHSTIANALIKYANNDDKEEAESELDKELLTQFVVAVLSNKLLLAYQIGTYLKTQEAISEAIRVCDRHGLDPVSSRLLNFFSSEEDQVPLTIEPYMKCAKFRRLEPPPAEEDEEPNAEVADIFKIPKAPRRQKESFNFFQQTAEALDAQKQREDDIVDELAYLENTETRKQSASSQRSKSSQKAKNAPKKKAAPKKRAEKKKRRLADDSSGDEEEKTKEVEVVKEKQPKRKRRLADDSGSDDEEIPVEEPKKKVKRAPKKKAKITKPKDVGDLSAFGFTKN